MDREKVVEGLQCIVDGSVRCESCGYAINKHGHHSCHQDCAKDVIALLKEDCHNCKLECLLQRYDQLKEKYENLLKEQEPKPDKCIICEGCGHKLQDDWNWCPWCRWETARGRRRNGER